MTRLGIMLAAFFALAAPQARAASDCAKVKGHNTASVPGIKVVERPFRGRDGEHGTVFHGCRKPHGPVYRLGRTTTRVGPDGTETPFAAFRVLQAQTAGLLVEQIVDGRRTVDLVETRGGMRTPIEGTGLPRPTAQRLVLAPSGVVAGVFADDPQRTDSPNPGETLVIGIAGTGPNHQWLYDFARPAPGAPGPAIPAESLRVEGGVLHWTRDGVARSQKLLGRPPKPPRRRARRRARCRSLRGTDLARGSSDRIKVVDRTVENDGTEIIGCLRPNGPRYTLASTQDDSDEAQDEGGYFASSSVEANWVGGTFVGIEDSWFADTAIEESSGTAYSVVDVRNGAGAILLSFDNEDDEEAEKARIKYDERGIAVIDGHKDVGYHLGVFTPNGWHYMDRGPEPLTGLAVKDGVVSWKRGGEPQARAIAAPAR